MIDEEGTCLVAEAKAVWAAGQDANAGEVAGAVLAQINPLSKVYTEASQLNDESDKRVKE